MYKKKYEKPEIKVVKFKTEMGFVSSARVDDYKNNISIDKTNNKDDKTTGYF